MRKRTIPQRSFVLTLWLLVCMAWSLPNVFAYKDLDNRITAAQNQWRSSGTAFWGEAVPYHPDQAKYPEERIQYILDRLIYVSPLRGYDIRAHISPNSQVNALTDGRRIIVNTGLLNAFAHDDHQLAAVLAHELSHILANHHGARGANQKSQVLTQIAAPFLRAVPYGSYATLGLREASHLNQASFSREQEKEADAIATILLMEAGYRPFGLTEFLEGTHASGSKFALPTQIPLSNNSSAISQSMALFLLRNSPFYKTHPQTSQRSQVVNEMAARKTGRSTGSALASVDPTLEHIYQVLERRRPKNRGGES